MPDQSNKERMIVIELPASHGILASILPTLFKGIHTRNAEIEKDENGKVIPKVQHNAYYGQPENGKLPVMLRGEWSKADEDALINTILTGLAAK